MNQEGREEEGISQAARGGNPSRDGPTGVYFTYPSNDVFEEFPGVATAARAGLGTEIDKVPSVVVTIT